MTETRICAVCSRYVGGYTAVDVPLKGQPKQWVCWICAARITREHSRRMAEDGNYHAPAVQLGLASKNGSST